jgi:hypothetical protein
VVELLIPQAHPFSGHFSILHRYGLGQTLHALLDVEFELEFLRFHDDAFHFSPKQLTPRVAGETVNSLSAPIHLESLHTKCLRKLEHRREIETHQLRVGEPLGSEFGRHAFGVWFGLKR